MSCFYYIIILFSYICLFKEQFERLINPSLSKYINVNLNSISLWVKQMTNGFRLYIASTARNLPLYFLNLPY